MRVARSFAVLAATMALGACNIYACRYKTRFVATSGAASGPAVGAITVQSMNFRDYSENEPIPRSLTWHIEAAGLVAPVTSISLRDERDTTLVVANIPVTGGNGTLAASALDLETAAERDRVFNLLTGNNGVVLVYAGPTGSPPLRIHLSVTVKEGWHRPSCD
jgi:hypothetical protein